MDHFRKIARVAGDIGVDVSFVLSWPNQKRYLDAFRGVIKRWEDFAVFGFLIDRVGRYHLEEFLACTYQHGRRNLPVHSLLSHVPSWQNSKRNTNS
jgi:1,2-phenylacetyl-CoA epoxidase catalytic subunit